MKVLVAVCALSVLAVLPALATDAPQSSPGSPQKGNSFAAEKSDKLNVLSKVRKVTVLSAERGKAPNIRRANVSVFEASEANNSGDAFDNNDIYVSVCGDDADTSCQEFSKIVQMHAVHSIKMIKGSSAFMIVGTKTFLAKSVDAKAVKYKVEFEVKDDAVRPSLFVTQVE